MTNEFAKTKEWKGVDRGVFQDDVLPANRPAILKGLVNDWPVVRAGRESPAALCDYIKSFDTEKLTDVLLGPPSIEGRFFYTEDLRGVNFTRRQARVGTAVDQLLSLIGHAAPPALYIQSAPLTEYLPGFSEANALAILDPEIGPRIWIGNALTVQTHFDLAQNVACVAAGRKRFTLFPPEQIANLYPGPLEFTLSGPPVSMAQPHDPDFEKYPRFREALAHAEVAELEPGDALFVPYHWWHHVESLDPLNVLVNYWWSDVLPGAGSPRDCLLHALLSVRTLPKPQRDVWRKVFDYYVFETDGDPVAHLPEDRRGVLGPPTPERLMQMRMMLGQALLEFAKSEKKR